MAVYFIAQIAIQDEGEYDKYLKKVDEVFSLYKGRYLAVDDNPDVMEGAWQYTRTVLIQFETKTDFNDWYYSDVYQQIVKHRLAGANCDSILIKGYN